MRRINDRECRRVEKLRAQPNDAFETMLEWPDECESALIREDALAIWLLDLAQLPPLAQNERWYRQTGLAETEIAAARGLPHEAGLRHLGARLLARHALAATVPCSREQLTFGRDRSGKPFIEAPSHARDWHFNLSHSGNLAACVVARYPVGIDVEPCQRTVDSLPIACSQLATDEADWVLRDPLRSRHRFLALWTLKEACLKARGIGLIAPLAAIVLRPIAPRLFCAWMADEPGQPIWYCRLRRLACGYWLSYSSPFSTPFPKLQRLVPSDAQVGPLDQRGCPRKVETEGSYLP